MSSKPTIDLSNCPLNYVRTYGDVEEFMSWLSTRREFLAFDIETEGLNVGRDAIRSFQFGDTTAGWYFEYQEWKGVMRDVAERYTGDFVAHNALFDTKFLKRDGIEIPLHRLHDTLPMAHLLDSARSKALKPLCTRYVDKRAAAGQSALKLLYGRTGWNWATVPLDHPTFWTYSALDTSLTAALAEVIYPQIQTWKSSYDLEMAVMSVIRDAELAGMALDMGYVARAVAQLEYELSILRPYFPFEPGSDKQAIRYFEAQGATFEKKTEKGNKQIDKFVLAAMEPRFPLAGKLREYRYKSKLLSTYFYKFQHLAVDGVLYPNTHPLRARTGRMSVSEPSMQNLPRGRVVRDAFVVPEGDIYEIADFEQQELRVMAARGNETAMLDAFRRGDDLHRWVASMVYGKPIEAVTKDERTTCKNGQFSIIYGAGVEKFAVTAKISVETATWFREEYARLFPGVAAWQQRTIDLVRARAGRKKFGYVETEPYKRQLMVEKDEAYKGCNYEIQGSCAQVTKERLVSCANAGLHHFYRLSVHDELIFQVPLEFQPEARRLIEKNMPDNTSFAVPLTVDCEAHTRWGEKYEGDPVIPLA